MQFGIRIKLIGALVLAGLVPLVLALTVVLVTVYKLRTDSIGRAFSSIAQQQADNLATHIAQQIEFITIMNHLPATADFLEAANAVPPLSEEEIDAIEARWPDMDEDHPLLREILDNPLAQRWQAIQRQHRRFAEVMITDRSGRLVAATQKTTDYFQADEEWWQECFADGRGSAFLSDLTWDESAISPRDELGTIVINLCMPIYADEHLRRGVLGVVKVSLYGGWLLDKLDHVAGPEHSTVWLVDGSGKPVAAEVRPPAVPRLPEQVMDRIRNFQVGWVRVLELEDSELIGFAAVPVPRRRIMSEDVEWYVIVATSRAVALGPVYRLIAIMLAVGVLVILFCFLAGWIIARREILRPILALSHGVGELTRGHINYRLPAPDGTSSIFRSDEIGHLAHDFNHMADELSRYVDQLERAAHTKEQFIDVASHELRTPVTYILGISQLAARQAPQEAPLLAKIHRKARRLARIVENMFKLLQGGTYQPELRLQKLDLAKVIRSAADEARPFVEQRQQRLELEVPDDLPQIQADEEKIRDVLSNLLSNAVRFSPDEGQITLRAAATDGGVEIVVSDRGPGIPPQDVPHLFQPFFTVRGELPRHSSGEYAHMTRGIGLGLSVVKRFVELHGGTVRIETSREGTSVFVRLPLSPSDAMRTNVSPDGS